jgi:ubiquitin C-terminal hydrolase
MLQHGTYVYELFSVMVHQGSASAGHYYAFIKFKFVHDDYFYIY